MEQPILVQKYGGSSVADPRRLQQVAQRVVEARQQGYRVVVVVSAMGDTTDQLMQMAHEITDHPPRRELDMLLSAGERISMALLSMAIHKLGHEAISFTGSQSGILTNDRHFDARIIEVRPVRIQDELERNKIVIVAGFQGMSYKREITTLGRGGSDTTAVALAAALKAEACEICSDVDGVYSADPRIIPKAEHIAEISYDAMEALARAGAKVLHADAITWAQKHGVALYARATSSKFGQPSGTLVRCDRDLEDISLLRPAIACQDKLLWMTIEAQTHHHPTIAAWWTNHKLTSVNSQWHTHHVEALFRHNDRELVAQALDHQPPGITIQRHPESVALISLVGEGIDRDPQWLQHGIDLLTQASLPVYFTQTDTFRASFLLPSQCQEQAQKLLYQGIRSHTYNTVLQAPRSARSQKSKAKSQKSLEEKKNK